MDFEGYSHIFTFDREDDKGLHHRVYESTENSKFRLLSQMEQPDGNVAWVWASDYLNTSKDAFWHGREALRQQRQQDTQQAEQRKKKRQGGQRNPSRCNKTQDGRVQKHKPRDQQASNARGCWQFTGNGNTINIGTLQVISLQPAASMLQIVAPGQTDQRSLGVDSMARIMPAAAANVRDNRTATPSNKSSYTIL